MPGAVLFSRLAAAQRLGADQIWVVASERVPGLVRTGVESWWIDQVPGDAICNLNPYLPPVEVLAAGGLVLRAASGTPEVLCIYRNGVWDLPKGKLDEGEGLRTCALREVSEETGLQALADGPLLATTVHGYARRGAYHIKTTYWYCFTSTDLSFVPQTEEGITEIAWIPWHEAEPILGYPTLRGLMQRVRPVLRIGE